jgi:hypothetical protein
MVKSTSVLSRTKSTSPFLTSCASWTASLVQFAADGVKGNLYLLGGENAGFHFHGQNNRIMTCVQQKNTGNNQQY